MAQGGVLGNGTLIGFSATNTSPITWTLVGQLMNVPVPTLVGERLDITTHSRTSNRRKYMPGLSDTGDVTLTVLSDFDPDTGPEFETLRLAQASGTELYWRVEIPVNRAKTRFRGVEFTAGVKDFAPGTPIDGAQTTDFVLTLGTDEIVWDTYASTVSELVPA
jgi:hypothetical protein